VIGGLGMNEREKKINEKLVTAVHSFENMICALADMYNIDRNVLLDCAMCCLFDETENKDFSKMPNGREINIKKIKNLIENIEIEISAGVGK
jgi:hypothetical protein